MQDGDEQKVVKY